MIITGEESIPLDRKLHHLLSGRWREAGADQAPRFWSPDGFERLQRFERRLRARCGLNESFPDPRCFARKLEIDTVCTGHVPPGCYGEIYANGVIAYRAKGGQGLVGARVYHGLSHGIYDQEEVEHTEADVWLLTVELAAPTWYLLQFGPHAMIEKQPWFPEWGIWLKHDLVERSRIELLTAAGT